MSLPSKALPVHDSDFRRRWTMSNQRCLACGIHGRGTLERHIEAHHLIKWGRSDEACNLAPLCLFCHNAAENLRSVRDGVVQPRLTLAHVLWLKRTFHPKEYNPARLEELRGMILPIPERPDDHYERLTAQNMPYRRWPPKEV